MSMYCPKCEMSVLTTREDFRIGLAIILAIFTGGIGLLIYMAIYLDKEKNRCIHCKTVCQIQPEIVQTNSNYQSVSYPHQNQFVVQAIEKVEVESKSNFCYNCGVQLQSSRDGAKFCPYCGNNIE